MEKKLKLCKPPVGDPGGNVSSEMVDGIIGYGEPRFQYSLSDDCPNLDILNLVLFSEQTCSPDLTSYERVGYAAHLSYKVSSNGRLEIMIIMKLDDYTAYVKRHGENYELECHSAVRSKAGHPLVHYFNFTKNEYEGFLAAVEYIMTRHHIHVGEYLYTLHLLDLIKRRGGIYD